MKKRLGMIVLALLPGALPAADDTLSGSLDTRVRYASVAQDNALEDADALTARLSAQGLWKPSGQWELLVDIEAIGDLAGDYNNTTNGEGGYSVVPDPDGIELNRAQVAYKGIDSTVVTVGRQRIKLDNDRFIGNVGWRQNEQTYDSVLITNTSLPDTTIKAGYIHEVHRIFGDDNPNGDWPMSSPIVNVNYAGWDNATIVVYGYFLSFDDLPLNSQRTIGVRFDRTSKVGEVGFKYGFELADQAPYRDGRNSNDARYRKLHAAATWQGVTFAVGQEFLSGDGTYGFATPLATAHAFNGWADLFLATPADGLDDRFISVGGKVAKFKTLLRYHTYSADAGGRDYGTEIEGIATRKFSNGINLGLKFASYASDGFGVDTDKAWIFASYRYQ
ncbi:MAG: hypothetical protein AAGF46_09515 [Pseudomonadota bacterium]